MDILTIIKNYLIGQMVTILVLYVFFIGYLAYLPVRKAWSGLKLWVKIILIPFLGFFGFIDIGFNFTLGTILFWEFPRKGEWTLSNRAKRYHDRLVENPNYLEKQRKFFGNLLAALLNPFSVAIGESDHI
jgi:energy-coupling factor transporter transmembrane protein EcfT